LPGASPVLQLQGGVSPAWRRTVETVRLKNFSMSGRVVKRAYKYRFYPTPEQAGLLNRTFGSVRYVYNRALAERSRAWTREQKRVTFAETCRMLTGWKNDPDTAWLYEVSNVALQQGLQHLQNAYVNFWGKRAKYPAFKSRKRSRASATFTTSGFRYRDGRVWLAKTTDPDGFIAAAEGDRLTPDR